MSCSSSFSTWDDYSKVLIDAAVPEGLLDYFDFHAYNHDLSPQVSYSSTQSMLNLLQPLIGGLHTVDAYTYVEHNTHMSSAITESNVKIANDSLEYVRSSHYNLRTFPLILSTMALLKHPDKIITRMLYDYKVCS